MSEDSPKIVSLETSLGLSEFLSEGEFPSKAESPSEERLSPGVVSLAQSTAAPGSGPVLSADVHIEPTPFPSAPLETAASRPISSSHVVADEHEAEEPAEATPHVGPATVTEFPVRPLTPAAVALESLPAGPVTLVELIERRGGFDWREAVAVIHQICRYLKEHSPHAPILLDPRNIQVTDKGEVYLLSGQTSSDPLVIQVGRLLRTMLMGKEAPPELRLLLSQATFELPIFESIEDVDRALAQLNKLDEPGPAGPALLRAVAAPPAPPGTEDFDYRPASIRSILPAHRTGRRARPKTYLGALLGGYASHVAVIFAAIGVIGGLLLTRPSILFPNEVSATPTGGTAAIAVATVPPAVPERTPAEPAAAVPSGVDVPLASQVDAPPRVRRPSPADRGRPGVVVATPLETRLADGDPLPPNLNSPRATTLVGAARTPSTSTSGFPSAPRPSPPPPSPRDSERRATSLLLQGQAAAASMAFDALVMSNPLYEPKTTDLTPEALSAFRTSQRLMLPVIARRDYDRAKSALDGGDPDRALALAREAMTIIDRRLPDTPPQLREALQDLVEQAKLAAAEANEIIYSEADTDVIPPRPLSRQMPVTGPIGVPPNRVGWLDMVIDRDGSVFFVKLTTPLNRHHERMIVSPAKAWRYQPATKNRKPVMYRIRVKVNLPESGTDF
jgi:hypothetical protein